MKDYLKYDTTSMKELLVQNLNEKGEFTDQLYPGSNLSVMIDIFSAMFSCLVYQLNVNATESIFTDAQFYESINRIVKILGYNPHGIITPTILCHADVKNSIKSKASNTDKSLSFPNGIITLPKYTTITTTLKDEFGKPVCYSLAKDYSIFSTGKQINKTYKEFDKIIDSDNKPLFYNGYWEYYSFNQISTGIAFETFTLTQLNESQNVAFPFIHIYVERVGEEVLIPYMPVINIHNSTSYDQHFEVRINENKVYEIKFGDSISGKRLEPGDKLHIIYLKSNGTKGEIIANQLSDNGQQTIGVKINGISEVFLREKILQVNSHSEYISFGNDRSGADIEKLIFFNTTESSKIKDFESVEEIREQAPTHSRMGNRVITHQDFKYYLNTNYSNIILDVTVMNNFEYMSDFQYWLSEYDRLEFGIRYFDYKFADSCDFNNIYLWIRSKKKPEANNQTAKYFLDINTLKIIETDLQAVKPLTAEVIFPNPIEKLFTPCLVNNNYSIFDWDPISDPTTEQHENMIVIFRDRNTLVSKDTIVQNIINIFKKYFEISNTKMGQVVDPSAIYNDIMAITGIQNVRIRFWKKADREMNLTHKQKWYDGLSFACWTPFLIDGQDLQIISGAYKLEKFQFPSLLDEGFFKAFIEVKSDKYSINEIEY